MDSFLRLLLRFIIVPLGYMAAAPGWRAVLPIGPWRDGTRASGSRCSRDVQFVSRTRSSVKRCTADRHVVDHALSEWREIGPSSVNSVVGAAYARPAIVPMP